MYIQPHSYFGTELTLVTADENYRHSSGWSFLRIYKTVRQVKFHLGCFILRTNSSEDLDCWRF